MKTNTHLFRYFFTQRGYVEVKGTLFHYLFLNIHVLQINILSVDLLTLQRQPKCLSMQYFACLYQGIMDCLNSEMFIAQSCLILQPHGLWPAGLLSPWTSPGKNTGVGGHPLLPGIFTTQGSNLHLLLGRQVLYH